MNCRIISVRVPGAKLDTALGTPESFYSYHKNKTETLESIEIDPQKKDSHDEWSNFDGYHMKIHITNDLKSHPRKLILEYNKRGGSERLYSYLKQNAAWRIPPFQKLAHNAVYLIVAALAHNIFMAVKIAYGKYTPGLYAECTLNTFRKIFIMISCVIENNDFVFHNTEIEIEKIK